MKRALPVAAALAAGLLLLWVWPAPSPEPPETRGRGDRPWEIEVRTDGTLQALGLTVGRSTLGEAIARFGHNLEAAVLESAGSPAVVEAYWSQVSAGGVTGRLVAGLEASPEVVHGLRQRGRGTRRLETGTVRADLHPRDAEVVEGLVLRNLTFAPTASLDEAVVLARFGEPVERLAGHSGVAHWLYPERGVAVTLAERGRDLVHYVLPADFGALRETLARRPTDHPGPTPPASPP
jgi:hypothetical protein